MKKIIIALTLVTSISILAGCSANNKTPNNSNNQEQVNNQEQTNNQEQNVQSPITVATIGKVDKIIGNEISIKLLADNFELTDEMKEALGIVELSQQDKDRLNAGETIELPGGSIMGVADPDGNGDEPGGNDASGEDPAIEAPGQDDVSEQDAINDYEAAEKAKKEIIFNKMEFSGESKDFTIKAGVTIINAITGKEASLSDIKKGSIVRVELDDKGSVVRVVIQY